VGAYRAPNAVRAVVCLAAAVLCVTVMPRAAAASPDEARPWAVGVSAERQAGAFRLFDEGNRAFEESKYGFALDKYRAALRHWDHPIIHFNMAVCFIHLDQPVDAYEHLAKAMVYGAAPLGEDLHSQGLTYEKLLAGRLARVQVTCAQAGVEVSLDGQPLFTCPGRAERVVLPGLHQLVARKPGHLTDARNVQLLPARLQVEEIALVPVQSTATLERRWSVWIPWIVVGSGVGVAAVGFGLRRAAASDFQEYDRAFADACPSGCAEEDVPGSVRDIRARARLENGAAIASLSAGAAAISVGAVLLFLNQPRPVGPDERAVAILPVVATEQLGVAVALRF
jgi:hypothetical protein